MLNDDKSGGGRAAHDASYFRGIVLVMLSGGFFSLAGILIRSIDTATNWQILLVRSGALALTLFCVLVARHGPRVVEEFRTAGATAVVGGLCLGAGFTGFVFSITSTTVANTVFILGASPFVTALLAWLILGERVRGATWIAMAVALIGVAVMVADGVRAGTLFGTLMALVAALGFAGFVVALRRGRHANMLPAVCLAGLFSALAGVAMAESYAYSLHDFVICAAMGVVQIGVGLILFTLGSRHVPAVELALLSLTEVILAPLLVWIGMGEVPSALTLVGGAVVLTAVTGQALSGMRRKFPPIGAV